MKVSHSWLQTYFKEKLPEPKKLADLFTFHAFEVEGVENVGSDVVYDLKVLPDRANYALSHKGIAYEASLVTDLKSEVSKFPEIKKLNADTLGLTINIEEKALCNRYIGRVVENITVSQSPAWLKERLEAVGQRSINSIVDATNFVMLDIGQPLHAFDKDLVKGAITVRNAKAGEKITTLDNKEVDLDASILVIADEEGPLAIAGVKGGIRAQVTEKTKNIIIESANFNQSSVRLTSTKVAIKNDSSKRFENGLSPVTAEWGMERVSALIAHLSPEAVFGQAVDIYSNKQEIKVIEITPDFITKTLGVAISEKEIISILEKMKIKVEQKGGKLSLTIPAIRMDLTIPEDIVEEVGRIHGYKNIPLTLPPKNSGDVVINKTFYYSEKIRNILINAGFSEVFTYALAAKGSVEIQNPLAADKGFLRENIVDGLTKSLELNARNADFLGLDQIKIFEIGNVFLKNKEQLSLVVAVQNIKKLKKKEDVEIQEILSKLSQELSVQVSGIANKQKNITEIILDDVINSLPHPKSWDLEKTALSSNKYQKISIYPFAVRDIAVFTPDGTTEKEVRDIIESKAGALLIKNRLFDVFTKTQDDGAKKTSYAFRMVFQSQEKTLTEEEINSIMTAITETMNGKQDWKVR